MTLSPPHPGLHGGEGGSGVKWGEAEQFATHLYLQLSVAFRGWGSRRVRCKTQVGVKEMYSKSRRKKKWPAGCKTEKYGGRDPTAE